MRGSTYIISGISGSGKSTISDRLTGENPNLSRAVTLSTRVPREGERFGVHYFFVTPDLFLWLLDTDQILEYTRVYGYTFYGTLRHSVESMLEAGKDVLFVVDSRGVAQIRKVYPDSPAVFLRAPSDDEQRTRLLARGTKGEDLEIRVAKAHEELEWAEQNHIPVVVNDDLEVALKEVKEVLFAGKK